jgi:acetylornithine deacetylase/succinyl-diaminopimelate desuccinylase-like protein
VTAEWFDELAEFLRIPSVSAQPEHAADVLSAGEWVRDLIRAAGGDCEIVDWDGRPLAIGEVPASDSPQTAPTVICYGHFDVQPPDPLELWESPPFELTSRGDRVYARGIADDKGQLYMMLAAARELAAAGTLPVNVRFTCDGEEEVGGHSIVDFIESDTRGADAAMIFDSGMIREDLPAFDLATRGVIYFHVELMTGARDLHSGLFGGAALNAAHALIRTLDQLIAKDGRLVEPLRQGINAPTAQELDDWKQLPSGSDELSDQGARPADPAAAEEFYIRTFAETALDVNGIESGSPHVQKTVIPIRASANVSIRVVGGQDTETIAAAFRELIQAAAPPGAELDVQLLSSAPPGLVPADAQAIRLGMDAFERVLGVRPALIRSGGTLPIVAAFADRSIPTIITGFSLPDANIHSPNENMLARYIPLGIETVKALFQELGKL